MSELEKALKDGLDRLAEESLTRTLEPGAGLDFLAAAGQVHDHRPGHRALGLNRPAQGDLGAGGIQQPKELEDLRIEVGNGELGFELVLSLIHI